MKPTLTTLLLILLMTTYAVYFSWYTINRHNTLHSYAADLSLIDQPMWHTSRWWAGERGHGFMELTWGTGQQPRLAEHFEPILVPLSLLFFIWDDVRILLIAQSIALAMGALPVFWIARQQLDNVNLVNPVNSVNSTHPLALVFVLVYLLSPHLQAANVADFHADPFVVAPLLFAFWYGAQQRRGWFWFWALVAMSVKETLIPLTTMLGVWLLWQKSKPHRFQKPVRFGEIFLIFVSIAWFFMTTFGIVAPLAQQYFGTTGPIYFAHRYVSQDLTGFQNLLGLNLAAKWHYVAGLLVSVGLLPLLAPDLLILGLPVLTANLLSNFAGQYSGEQHYSAPLVVAFIIASIYGTRRILDFGQTKVCPTQNSTSYFLLPTPYSLIILWLLAWSFGYHIGHGWTPFSTRVENYPMTTPAQILPEFLAQIPPESVVSASAALHPHLAHRRVAYVFPTVQEADYILVDVTDIPGVHPNDAQRHLMERLKTNWQILSAEHGLLLAKKSALPNQEKSHLPGAFFDFARARPDRFARPNRFAKPVRSETALTFGQDLQLLGYEFEDNPANGVKFRFYWQARQPLPADLHIWPLFYDDEGLLLSDPTQVPMVATLWYPPAKWQTNEVIVTETLPQRLPDVFHVGLAVGTRDGWREADKRWSPQQKSPENQGKIIIHATNWAQLATFWRQGTTLTAQPPQLTWQALNPVQASFGAVIKLTGLTITPRPETLTVLLRWTASAPPTVNYTVFLHLLDEKGQLISQADSYPTWLFPQPTSRWPSQQPMLDRQTLRLPANLPTGNYTLQIGLYNLATLERLPLADGRDAFTVEVQIR